MTTPIRYPPPSSSTMRREQAGLDPLLDSTHSRNNSPVPQQYADPALQQQYPPPPYPPQMLPRPISAAEAIEAQTDQLLKNVK